MKELMLGNAAVARALYEAGCRFVSSYPGTPSTEITEHAAEYEELYAEWAPNEKVAMEAALGASIGGARAFSAMKHVGMNVAADPMFTASYTGVNGGLVFAVADDQGMHSSQNEQDSRHYAIASKLPMLEPSDSAECLAYTKLSFELSEEYDTPILLRTCTRVAHSQSIVETTERIELELKPYEKNPRKYVMMPGNAIARHIVVEERMAKLAEFAETSELNRIEMGDTSIGFVTAGICYQYLREIFPNASILKLGMVNPLPVDLIKEFASKVDRLIVVEELDGVIETHCRASGVKVDGGKDVFGYLGELSQYKILVALSDVLKQIEDLEAIGNDSYAELEDPLPARPPVMCPGCPHRGTFYTLSEMGLTVFGDIGCYTLGSLAPLFALDTTICMGASISGLHGFLTVRGEEAAKNAICVIGDSTFTHSGITGLLDVAYNQGISTVMILDNSTTGMTGHQENPMTGKTLKGVETRMASIEQICEAAGIESIRLVDPFELDELKAVIREELDKSEPSVIIARRPCALLRQVKAKPALSVNTESCRSCKKCMDIGCPAVSYPNKKALIDPTLCVGCGLCAKMCAHGAIEEVSAL